MKFYDCGPAPNPRRARIFLAEKGIDIPKVQVNLREREQFSPEFRKLNPACTVPVLELDDGTALCEVVAIYRYLEEAYPDPPLLGVDARDKAIVAMWDHWCELDGFLAVGEAFRNSSPSFKGRALTGPEETEQLPALVERGRERVRRFFKTLDARLSEQEFVAGSRYTAADITALVTVDFAGWIKMSIPEECQNIRRWYAVVSERPSAQA
jgi:glutathione S-transferase